MRQISFFLLISILALNACKNNIPENTANETSFDFKVKGAFTGNITTPFGEADIQCETNRTIISLKEVLSPNISEDKDLLFGEIILAFLHSDSVGTFPLNGISDARVNGQVGFVALLNPLHFDDLSSQYISNEKRLQNIKNGTLTIKKWSKTTNEHVEGSLKVTLIDEGQEVTIQGSFSILVKDEYEFCLK